MNTELKPRTSVWKILFRVLLALSVVYVVHVGTVMWAEPELESKKVRIRALRAEVKELGQRLEASRVRQKMAERQVDVLRHANSLLRQEESSRQEEMQRLQGEVTFYQRLADTSGSQEGLAVYEMELQTTASPQVYRFVLTLTQNLRRSAIISGTVGMELEGTRGDQPLTLKWKDISASDAVRPEFQFKYFQQLAGYVTVPANFQPQRMRVFLNAKNPRQSVDRDFAWADLLQAGNSAPLPATAGESVLESEVPDTEDKP